MLAGLGENDKCYVWQRSSAMMVVMGQTHQLGHTWSDPLNEEYFERNLSRFLKGKGGQVLKRS